MASIWELAIKSSKRKIILPGNSIRFLIAELANLDIQLLPIDALHLERVEELPHFHNDPFDRLIIAQSAAEGIPIVTADRAFHAYDVEILWE